MTTPAAELPRTDFQACGSCGQKWPGSLLFTEGAQRVCGNCKNRHREEAKKGRLKAGAGNGLTAWVFIGLAIVSAGYLSYKATHPGPPVPKQRAPEMTAPSTYKK